MNLRKPHFRVLQKLAFFILAACTVLTLRNLSKGTSVSELSYEDRVVLRKSWYPLANKQQQRKAVLIAPTTHHYKSFLTNLQCSLRRHAGKDAIVVAFDTQIAEYARDMGFSVIGPLRHANWENDATATPHPFRSSSFRSITKLKLKVVREILLAGYDVILTDVDIVWCDDAIERLSELVGNTVLGDILIQSDACRYDPNWIRLNTGFYYAKSTAQVIAFFEDVISFASKPENSHLDDQKSFVQVACKGTKISWKELGKQNVDICKWNNLVHIRALPIDKYVNGAVFFNGTRVSRLAPGVLNNMCHTKQIVMWHNNWCSADKKLGRFHGNDMWLVDDATGNCMEEERATGLDKS